jgi:hypothetical protein
MSHKEIVNIGCKIVVLIIVFLVGVQVGSL